MFTSAKGLTPKRETKKVNKMSYFAIELISGTNTTTGTPNPVTGHMSIAVSVECFTTKLERDEWVSDNSNREATNKKELRSYHLGMSVSDFNELIIENLESELEWA